MLGLTERQYEVLRTIHRHTLAMGTPPSIRELCVLCGCRSTNAVTDHLAALRRKGYLRERAPGSVMNRALRLSREGLEALGVLNPHEVIADALSALHRSPL